jgi:hypothetical protein
MKMKISPTTFGFVSLLCVCVGSLGAQETNDVDQLRTQLRQLQEQFERVQQEHKTQIDNLSRKLDELTRARVAEADKKKLEQELAAEMAKDVPKTAPPSAINNAPWSPASPIRLQSGGSFMDIGLVGTFAVGSSTTKDIGGVLELGGHDPNQRGFTVQGVEANFAGTVDPYFRGNANVLFQVDSSGQSQLELEEAWMETISLPANLQVRAGQILTDFGRLNPTHPHSWGFVDTPLVLGRFMGPDGLRNPGARISWLAPTPFYSELVLSVQNSQGETAYSFRNPDLTGNQLLPYAYRNPENNRGIEHIQDLLFAPRYTASFDLSDSQVLLAGASAAFGPNASGDPGTSDTTSQIYGLDLTWKWKSPNQHGGFPFVSFQTEALLRRYEAGAFNWDLNGNGTADPGELINTQTGLPAVLRAETLTDYGFYSQLLYGFHQGWVAGLRFDYVSSDPGAYEALPLSYNGELVGRDPQRAQRWRLSPNLTWYPSEFSKLRLQYNLDDRLGIGVDQSVWLQFEFLIGAHAAHKF